MPRESAAQIDAAAAAWAGRADRGLTAAEEGELDAWLEGDVRRVGAYAKARAVSAHTERARALYPNFDASRFGADAKRGGASRRTLLLGGGGAIAAAIAAAVVLPARLGVERYATRRGEVRVVALKDGSVVTLNTATAIDVRYTGRRRDIRLVKGEALFDVAKDRARPFVVRTLDTEAVAVGTRFSVRRFADERVQVLVSEGVVEVRRAGTPARAQQPIRLTANTRAVADPRSAAARPDRLPDQEVQRQLAWRQGQLAFEGETLDQAAAEFARYSDTRVVVDDPALGREEITGLYQANDPVGFARAVATAFDARAEVAQGEVRLSR